MWGICPGRPHRDQRLQLLVQGLRRADLERVHQRPGDLVAEPVQHPSVSTTTGPAPAASASGSAGVVVPSAAFRLGPDVVAVCRAGGGPGRIHLGGRSRRPRLPPRHTPSAQPPRAGKQRRQARQSSAHQSPAPTVATILRPSCGPQAAGNAAPWLLAPQLVMATLPCFSGNKVSRCPGHRPAAVVLHPLLECWSPAWFGRGGRCGAAGWSAHAG